MRSQRLLMPYRSAWADSYLEQIERCMRVKINSNNERTMPKVKVAILDTGIDHEHPTIEGLKTRVAFDECDSCYKCFVIGESAEKPVKEATQDRHGHGTHIAALLARVAPRSLIYIAKIAESIDIPLENRIAEVRPPDSSYADHSLLTSSKAIDWARDKKVDIISMSFGFSRQQKGIYHAIQTAASYPHNILMFAAASNKGQAYEPTFPANESQVMCIYAADGNGNKARTNARSVSRETRFATAGIALKSAWPVQPGLPDIVEARKSGTSFATPVAAGIAACILEFALQQGMEINAYSQIKTVRGISKVFKLMMTESDGLDFIYPCELFHELFRPTTTLDLILKAVK